MATKTISIDLEAYERLRRARRSVDESFSKVIKRARWPVPPKTAHVLLVAMDKVPVLGEDELERLDSAQASDHMPEDPWRAE